jgi:hypothetical protein
MPGPGHGNDGLGGTTLQQHPRPDVGDVAGRVEPRMRGKAAPKKQQRFTLQL